MLSNLVNWPSVYYLKGVIFTPKFRKLNFFTDFHGKKNVRRHLRNVFFSISYLAVLA